MSTPEPSRPRVVETPLPFVRADAPTDVELGVTTSDDGGQWATTPPRASTVTRGGFGTVIIAAGGFKAKYLLLKRGWHRRRL